MKNLLFYKRMFGDLFLNNLIVVVTNYKQNKEWLMEQKIEKKCDPTLIVKKMIDSLKENLEVGEVVYYCINSLPIHQDDILYSNFARKLILLSTLNQNVIGINKLRLPKLERWINNDKLAINKVVGEINGINNFITVIAESIKTIDSTLRICIDNIQRVKNETDSIRTNLLRYDNSETILQITYKYVGTIEWYRFYWKSMQIKEICKYDIHSYAVLQGYGDIKMKDNSIEGTIWGYFYSDISVFIKVYTTSKLMYKHKIMEWVNDIKSKNILLKTYEDDYANQTKLVQQDKKTIKKYQDTLDSLNGRKKELESEYIEIYKIKSYLTDK